jgi:lipoprotein-releasing system ATP-binding protein
MAIDIWKMFFFHPTSGESNTVMLEATNISKDYPTPNGPLRILSDVSLRLSPGDAVSIMGPSGSGKSTLLYVLGALESPSSGKVTLEGQDPFTLKEKELAAFRNQKVGFIFQDHCLLPQCSVIENVLTPSLVGDSDGNNTTERARALLKEVGLEARLEHRPAELSGGEKQRVALARALIMKPKLLLCDEPTGNLDHKSAEVVASLLFDLHQQQETILIVVTHSSELADRFPTRFELHEQGLRER